VQAGDRVALMSENRIEVIDSWFACAWLGAILVPFNTATRGPQLQHVLTDSDPRVFVLEERFLEHLEVLDDMPRSLERLWVLDREAGGEFRGFPVESFPAPGVALDAAVRASRRHVAILYTSGTDRAVEGRDVPQAQFYWWAHGTAADARRLTQDDVLYTCLPLFHTNALTRASQALGHGAAEFVVGRAFSASPLWDRVARRGRPRSPTCSARWSRSSRTPPRCPPRSGIACVSPCAPRPHRAARGLPRALRRAVARRLRHDRDERGDRRARRAAAAGLDGARDARLPRSRWWTRTTRRRPTGRRASS